MRPDSLVLQVRLWFHAAFVAMESDWTLTCGSMSDLIWLKVVSAYGGPSPFLQDRSGSGIPAVHFNAQEGT